MNEQEFKRHLKDLAHGHHHPEEHDWSRSPAPAKKAAGRKPRAAARKRMKKNS